VKATIHWVSAADSVPPRCGSTIRCSQAEPDVANFAGDLNPNSLEVLNHARVEPAVAADNTPAPVQFERIGYFARDKDSAPGRPVFNRTVGLRDTFAKEIAKG
jgi:glutaminyl-tRNA synthetase